MTAHEESLRKHIQLYGDDAYMAARDIEFVRKLVADSETQTERLRAQLADLEFRLEYAQNMRGALDVVLAEGDVAEHLASLPEFVP